jgi:hypothetical protein
MSTGRGTSYPDRSIVHDLVAISPCLQGRSRRSLLSISAPAQDWATYGKIQQSLSTDPDYQGLLIDAGNIATWENYVSQTIDV